MTKPFKDQLKVFSVSLDYTIFLGVGKRNLGLLYENDQLDAFLFNVQDIEMSSIP